MILAVTEFASARLHNASGHIDTHAYLYLPSSRQLMEAEEHEEVSLDRQWMKGLIEISIIAEQQHSQRLYAIDDKVTRDVKIRHLLKIYEIPIVKRMRKDDDTMMNGV